MLNSERIKMLLFKNQKRNKEKGLLGDEVY